MNNTAKLKIGWAQTSITPDRPVYVLGQMYQRISKYVHDPIMAVALALERGEEQLVLICADMTEVPLHAMDQIRANVEAHDGLRGESLSFHVTHTHTSSDFFGDFLREDNEKLFGADRLPKLAEPENLLDGEEASAFLTGRLTELVLRAWENRTPGGISGAHEYAAVGFNRRPVFAGGGGAEQSVMYGDCSLEGFRRMEAGSDHSAELLFTWDTCGNVTGVLVNIACPSQVYELHSFLSADFWGPARDEIRAQLGNIHVMAACGAAGDQTPIDMVHISKHNRDTLGTWASQEAEVFRNFDMTITCQQIGRRIADAVARGYESARNYIDYAPAFIHRQAPVRLPIRLVGEAEYLEALERLEALKASYSPAHPMPMKELVAAFEPQGVALRWELQQQTDVYMFPMHVVRLGGCAFATNPFELFHEYGLRIKARARAEQVFLIQLSGGMGGYLPSESAVSGGSYSSKPASTMCGPQAGDLLVEETLRAMDVLWAQ